MSFIIQFCDVTSCNSKIHMLRQREAYVTVMRKLEFYCRFLELQKAHNCSVVFVCHAQVPAVFF